MELEIVPALCKPTKDESGADVAPLFTGSVTIRLPSVVENYKLKAKYTRKTMGMQNIEDKVEQACLTMDLLADMAGEIQPYFVKVDLKEAGAKKACKSVDELYHTEALFPVISEIAMKFIQGFATKD
jgi:hypothetical protein